MTGVEPILVPILTKAAAAGAAKATSSAVDGLVGYRRKRKVRAFLGEGQLGTDLQELNSIEPAKLELLMRFCDSPEIERYAAALSRAYLVEGQTKKSANLVDAVNVELRAAIEAELGSGDAEIVSAILFAALNETVLRIVKRLDISEKVPARLQAELVKTVGSLAGASIRNAELLSSLSNLDDINYFVDKMRRQIAALHGTMRLPHAGTTRQVPYDQLYVQPRLVVGDRERSVSDTSTERVVFASSEGDLPSIETLLETHTRIVVLGDPGGGKSTLSEKLIYDTASNSDERRPVPFLVVLRDYAKFFKDARPKTKLLDYLQQSCDSPYNVDCPREAIEYLLLNGRALVVFDGLDELLDTSLRRSVVQVVEAFSHMYPTCPILVTSRRVGYAEAPLDSDLFRVVQLGDFTEDNVRTYADNWFKLDESVTADRKRALTSAFMADSNFVPDLRSNPLMLSLMCGIYASENYIPTNRPDVYEKCSLLLFERWDKQRDIKSPLPFDAHVREAMRSLALYMYGHQGEEGIPRARLIDIMKGYLLERRFEDENEAENAAIEFIDFCKGRAWVLTDIGADTYGFTHRTFLEYFAASQLVRLNPAPEQLFNSLQEQIEVGSWDVVAQLSLQIVGRNAEDGSDLFLEHVLEAYSGREVFDQKSYNLLSFALRSLSFVVPKHGLLKRLCSLAVETTISPVSGGYKSSSAQDTPPMEMLAGASKENQPRVGKILRDILGEVLAGNPSSWEPYRATFINMGAGGFAGRHSFWSQWSLENLQYFSAPVKSASRKIWWLAEVCWEEGHISLDDLLRQHGLGALYRFDFGEENHPVPPFAYRYLRSYNGLGTPGVMARIGRKRSKEITDELNASTSRICSLKFRYRAHFPVLAENFDFYDKDRVIKIDSEPCKIILSLPIIEIMSLTRKVALSVPSREIRGDVHQLLAIRLGLRPAADAPQRLLDCLSRDTDARATFHSWLRGEHDFVGGAKPRMPSASDLLGDRSGA